ncbi:hypothetical protein ACFL4Y_02935, partial [Gemmatimonadota bacterium]
EVTEQDSYLFDVRPEVLWARPSGTYPYQTDKEFRGENPPNGPFIYYYFKAQPRSAELIVSDLGGEQRFTTRLEEGAGLHALRWDRRFDPDAETLQRFITSMRQSLEQLSGQADRTQQRQLDRLGERLTAAGADLPRLRAFQEEFSDAMQTMGLRGRGGSLSGRTAGAGEYLVTLVVDGKTMKTTLLLEEDQPGYIVR